MFYNPPSIQDKIVLQKSSPSIVQRKIFPAGPVNHPGKIFDPVSRFGKRSVPSSIQGSNDTLPK